MSLFVLIPLGWVLCYLIGLVLFWKVIKADFVAGVKKVSERSTDTILMIFVAILLVLWPCLLMDLDYKTTAEE